MDIEAELHQHKEFTKFLKSSLKKAQDKYPDVSDKLSFKESLESILNDNIIEIETLKSALIIDYYDD